jgi:hypothetical protein
MLSHNKLLFLPLAQAVHSLRLSGVSDRKKEKEWGREEKGNVNVS